MIVENLNSSEIYRKMMLSRKEKRDDIYRYELMMPLKEKWDCYHIPMKAEREGGYDIIMASEMLGILPPREVDEQYKS